MLGKKRRLNVIANDNRTRMKLCKIDNPASIHQASSLFEIAPVLVCLNHVAIFIVNANHVMPSFLAGLICRWHAC
jgi:hypothetical protein